MTQLKNTLLKKGKKGFTLTELAIVIAVIAILIAVLVPTFTSVITKARITTAAENAHSSILAYSIETTDSLDDTCVIKSGDYYFKVTGGAVSTDDSYYSTTAYDDVTYEYTWTDSENESLPTIYASATYIAAHSNIEGYAISAAEAAISSPSAATYYAKVTYSTANTFYLELTYDTSDKAWTAAKSISSSDYTTAVGGNGTTIPESITGYTGYTVSYIAGS